MITLEQREQVRQRANFACEFCGITEIDTGDSLTIDHFQPKTKGGSDNLANLVYCCMRCNQYKLAYWPLQAHETPLWNPRQDTFGQHFLELENGLFHPLTVIGEFTINRLRLNRPLLVAYRSRKQERIKEKQLLKRYEELTQLLELFYQQLSNLTSEQQELLKEQRDLLKLMIKWAE